MTADSRDTTATPDDRAPVNRNLLLAVLVEK